MYEIKDKVNTDIIKDVWDEDPNVYKMNLHLLDVASETDYEIKWLRDSSASSYMKHEETVFMDISCDDPPLTFNSDNEDAVGGVILAMLIASFSIMVLAWSVKIMQLL